MNQDLQQRAQPYGLILVRIHGADDRVRIGSPGRYITFPSQEAASAALDLLDLCSSGGSPRVVGLTKGSKWDEVQKSPEPVSAEVGERMSYGWEPPEKGMFDL